MSAPTTSVWISCVPSYVDTDSRLTMWRKIGCSRLMPLAPQHAPHAARDLERHRHIRAFAKADLRRAEAAAVLELAQLIREQLRLADGLQGVDQLVLRQLETGDAPTELLAQARVLE